MKKSGSQKSIKTCCALLLSVLFVQTGFTQARVDSLVADTLDWHRYSPLEVGNVWEYEVTEVTSQLRRELIRDTLPHGSNYFLMRETWQGGTIQPPKTLFVRYDTAGVVVTVNAIEEDTTDYPRPFPIEPGAQPDFLEYFDFRTAFGDTLFFDEKSNEPYWVEGGFEGSIGINAESVDVAGLKCLHRLWWFECYATDVGFVYGGSLQGFRLTYARIGGQEYGTSRFTSVEPNPVASDELLIASMYPNPVASEMTLVYKLSQPERVVIELFSLLGQKVRSEAPLDQPAGTHRYVLKTSGLGSGAHFVRVRTATGKQAVQATILRR